MQKEMPQKIQNLLEWAQEACETTRAFYDVDDDRDPPSWLAELEAAVKEVQVEVQKS